MNLFSTLICIALFISLFPINILRTQPLQAQSQNNHQEVHFDHISLEQGLSQSTIWCIYQDSKGFMWFGTQEGLNRFDGYRFRVFKHEPDNPHSISSNVVRVICEARNGDLWMGTLSAGINRFDTATERFFQYQHDPQNPNSLSNDQVLGICEDPGQPGTIWVGTGNGLNKFDSHRGEWTHFFHDTRNPNSLVNNSIWPLYMETPDDSGRYALWVGTGGGLDKLTLQRSSSDSEKTRNHSSPLRSEAEFIHYRNNPKNPNSLSFNAVWAIYPDPRQPGVLWIGTYSGLNRFDSHREQWTVFRRLSELLKPGGLFISSTPCLAEKKTIKGFFFFLLIFTLSKLGIVPSISFFKIPERFRNLNN